MIQYRINLLGGGQECLDGAALPIGFDKGVPKYGSTAAQIDYIEVYVSGSGSAEPGEFEIVGTELCPDDSYVDEGRLEETSNPVSDPGRFLGWKREVVGMVRTLTLSFKAPESGGSTYRWQLYEPGAPPPVIKVRIKRQQAAESEACSKWTNIP